MATIEELRRWVQNLDMNAANESTILAALDVAECARRVNTHSGCPRHDLDYAIERYIDAIRPSAGEEGKR